jgi:hypothetical protein
MRAITAAAPVRVTISSIPTPLMKWARLAIRISSLKASKHTRESQTIAIGRDTTSKSALPGAHVSVRKASHSLQIDLRRGLKPARTASE